MPAPWPGPASGVVESGGYAVQPPMGPPPGTNAALSRTRRHYTSNAPGFSGGFGLTYKFSRFSNERFYAEARYVFVDNAHRAGVTVTSPVASTYAEANDFPANSNHTTYFPIKFGIRF
jgi:hypothetical protein